MKSALQGAIRTMSASRARLMCGMLLGSRRVPLRGVDRAAAQGLQGDWRDELLGGSRHHHLHGGALLDERPAQVGGLVTGDAAAEAQHNVFAA
jgi:hypothetical protein